MPKTLKPDRSLFLTTLALVVLGLIMVFSASAVIAKARYGDATFFSFRQLMAGFLGLAFLFVIMKVDYHLYKKPAFIFTALALAITLCTVVFFLPATRNTYRWIQLPGLSFQPSELAKLVSIVFLAYFLEKRKGMINELSTLAPIGVMVGLLAGLVVLQKDLGTALALLATAAVLLYVSGLNMRWIGIATLFAIPVGAFAFYRLVYLKEWRWNRILAFWNPELDPQGISFQVRQSLIAVGSGGLNGQGYMEGKQKLFYLPDAHTDFLFAVIGEELGLIGTLMVLLLFGVFFWRGLRAAFHSPDGFGFYLALGITMMISLQALINMSVVLKLVPNKGIPLPFLSYGGSSLVMMLIAVGILLNVSQQSRRVGP
jgi:cell division protein FtsW